MLRLTALAAGMIVALGAAPMPHAPGYTLGHAPGYAPGLSFVIRSASSSGSTVPTPSGPGTRVQALNGILRFDGEQGRQSASGSGAYTIVNPAAKTISIVMPSSRQYIEMNWGDSTGQAMGAMAAMMAATTVVSDIQVSGSALGGGGSVNGYNTNRYRITTSYAEVQGSASGQRKVRMVEEFWVTSNLRDIPDPMEAFTRAFGGSNGMPQLGGTMAELMRRRGDAQRGLFRGLPIKSVVRTSSTERDGTTQEEVSTTEIVDLKRIDVDPAAFRVPAGYAKMDMKAFMNVGNQLRNALRNAGGGGSASASANGNDSTSIATDLANAAKAEAKSAVDETKQGAKQGAKDAAKGQVEAAKNKAKCALGGMFGKKKGC